MMVGLPSQSQQRPLATRRTFAIAPTASNIRTEQAGCPARNYVLIILALTESGSDIYLPAEATLLSAVPRKQTIYHFSRTRNLTQVSKTNFQISGT